MFIQKDEVHPTVQFVKDEYGVTWKEMGVILSDKMFTLGYELSLSPANVRNFATSRSSAWWFWPRISEIVVGIWEIDRKASANEDDVREVDLKYSGLFSEDLKAVYSLWHTIKKESQKYNGKECSLLPSILTLTNSVVNEHQSFFGIEFPLIEGLDGVCGS